MLCSMNESEDGRLINALANSDEMEIFTTTLCKDLIDFRWNQFGFRNHFKGLVFHVIYILALFTSIGKIYFKSL